MHRFDSLKIAVAGTGYVGLSLATLLSQHHQVTAVDIIPEKVEKINKRISPIQDEYIEKYFAEKELDLTATLDGEKAYADADFVIIAAPTNYDSRKNFFDTSAVEAVIDLVMKVNPDAIMVIKSTIPVGYTKSIRERTGSRNIIFSPEFLRESKALYDNLYPSRIIVGTDLDDGRLADAAHTFAALLQEGAIDEGHQDPVHGVHRGGGRQTVREHVSRAARELFQRAGHVRGVEGVGHPADHRRRVSGPAHRHALQQPELRVRRLLPAEGHEAAARELSGCAGEPDRGDRGVEPHS